MMQRRDFLNTSVMAALTLPLSGLINCSSRKAKPNILLILSDDAGYNDFGFQGSKDMLTPRIDALAADGVIFKDAHVTATVCSPSRAGLLTGRYQQRFGHEANAPAHGQGMDTTETTIADVLKDRGWATAIFGKWHLGETEKYHPNKRGFEEFFGMLGGGRSYFFSEKQNLKAGGRQILHNKQPAGFRGYYTDELAEKTCRFIDSNRNNPFFVFLSFTAVHTPMQAKEEHLAKFKNHARPVLAAMTWAMDEAVGKVVDKLQAIGQLENTLIIFTNDNGGAAFNTSSNKPLKGWKGNKFEGGQRVPFFLFWKNHIPGGKTFTGLTSTLDIFPTLLSCAGITRSPGKELDGVDLFPFIRGEKKGVPHELLFWRKEEEAAVRWNNWKLIRLKGYGFVLYDLKDNTKETRNLIEKYPRIFKKMKSFLESWEQELSEPDWHEGQDWREVTYDIHKALMENKVPEHIQPY